MAEAYTTPLEMRLDARRRLRREFPHSRKVAPLRRCIEYGEHVLGILCPVRRQMQAPASADTRRKQGGEFRLDQAAFLLPLLRPRIGEVNAHLAQGRCTN